MQVYVETIELSPVVWEMITVADREGDQFVELVKLHCQVWLIGDLATQLRLTPRSRRARASRSWCRFVQSRGNCALVSA